MPRRGGGRITWGGFDNRLTLGDNLLALNALEAKFSANAQPYFGCIHALSAIRG